MQKYFVKPSDLEENILTGADVFHIKNVMRNRIGDKILVSDQKQEFLVEITSISEDKVAYKRLEEKIGNVELPVFVSLFQGYPKGDKMEDVIKHGTELGVYEVYPTIMKRSVFKLDPKKKDSKLERFNKIAKEAAEQAHRLVVPKVVDIKNLKEIDFSSYDIKILCYEESAKNGELVEFKRAVKNMTPGCKVAIVVGPEGGIDDAELEYLNNKGFVVCGLGPRILRTETVVFYALSSISYELELK